MKIIGIGFTDLNEEKVDIGVTVVDDVFKSKEYYHDEGYKAIDSDSIESALDNIVEELKPDLIVMDNNSYAMQYAEYMTGELGCRVMPYNTSINEQANIYNAITQELSIKDVMFWKDTIDDIELGLAISELGGIDLKRIPKKWHIAVSYSACKYACRLITETIDLLCEY